MNFGEKNNSICTSTCTRFIASRHLAVSRDHTLRIFLPGPRMAAVEAPQVRSAHPPPTTCTWHHLGSARQTGAAICSSFAHGAMSTQMQRPHGIGCGSQFARSLFGPRIPAKQRFRAARSARSGRSSRPQGAERSSVHWPWSMLTKTRREVNADGADGRVKCNGSK